MVCENVESILKFLVFNFGKNIYRDIFLFYRIFVFFK